jgi:hypothetical protein
MPRLEIATKDNEHHIDNRNSRLRAETRLLVYPRLGALHATLQESRKVHLGSCRSLKLSIQAGHQRILHGFVFIRSVTAGLRLHTAEATTLGGHSSLETSRIPGEIILPPLAAGSAMQIHVPYSGEHALHLAVLLQVRYRTENSEYVFMSKSTINMGTPLDVSVQDVIKQDAMIPGLWIRAMTGRPIRVLDVKLEGSETYEVQPLLRHNEPTVISEQHPLCATFRIRKIDKHVVEKTSSKYHKPLLFQVRYRDAMEDLVYHRVEKLKEELAQGDHGEFDGLLVRCYEHWLNETMESTDMSRIERIGRMELPQYQVASLPRGLQSSLDQGQLHSLNWLQRWHNASLLPLVLQHFTDSYRLDSTSPWTPHSQLKQKALKTTSY